MNKTTLTLGEIYALDAELNGSFKQPSGERLTKGLLGQQISLLQKYWVGELNDSVQKHKKNIDKLRDELIIKFGEGTEKSGYTIPLSIDKKDAEGNPVLQEDGTVEKVLNPNFEEFNKEVTVLFEETREIEHYPFKLENFDIETDEFYPIFMKLLKLK